MKNKIGFIGLGNMGIHMANNLIKAGYHLQVYNRTEAKILELDQASVTVCKTPAEAASGVPVLISMLSQDDVLRESTVGADGILKTFPANAVHISMSTIAPDTAEELANLHKEHGSKYLASPVFGSEEAFHLHFGR